MKPEELTEEHIIQIFKLYKKHCGGLSLISHFIDPDYGQAKKVLEDVQSRSFSAEDGYRIGSHWTMHSKLRFKYDWKSGNVIPKFNGNLPQDHPKEGEAMNAGKEFEKVVLEYLCNEKPLSYDEVRQIPTYDQIKCVIERFGNPFERDKLKIEEKDAGIFNVIDGGELVYSNIKEQRDPTAAVVKPGEWEMELYKLYVEAQK